MYRCLEEGLSPSVGPGCNVVAMDEFVTEMLSKPCVLLRSWIRSISQGGCECCYARPSCNSVSLTTAFPSYWVVVKTFLVFSWEIYAVVCVAFSFVRLSVAEKARVLSCTRLLTSYSLLKIIIREHFSIYSEHSIVWQFFSLPVFLVPQNPIWGWYYSWLSQSLQF